MSFPLWQVLIILAYFFFAWLILGIFIASRGNTEMRKEIEKIHKELKDKK